MTDRLLFTILSVLDFNTTITAGEQLYKLGEISKNEYVKTIKEAEETKNLIISKLVESVNKAAESIENAKGEEE